MHIKTAGTIWRHEKWQECLHAELRALGFVLALCMFMCSLSFKNKVGSWSQFFFSIPEACWFSSLWMRRYVLNWASMKKKESLSWVEVLVGISVHDDPASKVQSCDCECLWKFLNYASSFIRWWISTFRSPKSSKSSAMVSYTGLFYIVYMKKEIWYYNILLK